jgi:serine/threonine protein kinase
MLRSEAGDESWPLIMDFGLARAVDQDSRQRSSASNSTLLGTLGYIAPEQLDGKEHSKASDVYAFGIVWFEMLTGELPFESSSSPAVAVLERVRRPAPAPSTINPLVPRDLDAIVLGCLRRSPKDRYRTAGEVLVALDAIESRQRSASTARKLFQAAIALGLGGVAAYWALSAPPKRSLPNDVVSTIAPALPAPVAPEPVSNPETVDNGATPADEPHPAASEPGRAVAKHSHARRVSEPAKPEVKGSAGAAATPASSSPAPVEKDPPWENPFRKREPAPPGEVPHPT